MMADWIQRMRTISCIKLVLSKHMHTHGEKLLKVQVIVDSPVKLGKPGVCFVTLVSL